MKSGLVARVALGARPPPRLLPRARSAAPSAFHHVILNSGASGPRPTARVSTPGCGSGRHIYEYREAGFCNAFGCDIRDFVALGSPADRSRFASIRDPAKSGAIRLRTAFLGPPKTFDFVFATSVFERVMDQNWRTPRSMRCSSPEQCYLNIFPSKWRLIEAHVNIIFGGVYA
jgi:hypothetical protein